MHNHSSILSILWRYKQRIELTPDEENILHEWLKEGETNQRLFDELSNDAIWEETLKDLQLKDTSHIWEYIESRLSTTHQVTVKPMRWWRYAAAAVVLLLTGLVLFWLKALKDKSPDKGFVQKNYNIQHPSMMDSGVVLTIENGRSFKLDSNGRQLQALLGDVVSQVGDNKLSYTRKTPGMNATVLVYHTLSIPAGGQFQVVLADGSRVWLNARSKLRYPSSFGDSVRHVELDGEGYFEVFKNSASPFIVSTKKAEVRVLGTKFNLHAYDDGTVTRTTLVSGSVSIENRDSRIVIKPGEEGRTSGVGRIEKRNANLKQATAWRENLFWFSDADYEEIMLQISRWYNLEIVYQGKFEGKFSGILPRSMPLVDLLNVLEKGGSAKFLLRGRTLTVIPA